MTQVDCSVCGEEYDLDAPKCPNCGSSNIYSKRRIAVFGALGVLTLPLSYIFLPMSLGLFFDGGFITGTLTGFLGILSPLFLLIAAGSYVKKKRIRSK
ncbi:MAG: hypothetical protein SV760_01915 [Halobacteria archaeon]|nr:hypothetical protein [Halobacteria archaeon]